jgi:hypothetical protein
MFAERTLSEGPIAADQIYGPNMAVRKAIFDLGFRYDEEMSPNGLEDYLMGEETELCQRVARAGFRCWFARRPLVRHIVRPDQLTADAWARRAYRCGRGRAYYMWKTGEIIAPPKVSIADRLACLSPLPRHKFSSICARYIARGFRDEWVSRLAMVENGR